MSKRALALFDLDHTLLPLDSDFSWGEFTTRIGWTDAKTFSQRNDDFFAQYKAGTLDINDYVRFATQAICKRGQAASLAARSRYMQEVILPHILPPARALVEAHRAAGDTLIIVTATNEFVTRPIADAFGVSELIAVELEKSPVSASQPATERWYTGAILGTPSVREGKITRVSNWLAARGWGWEDVETTFYSDSMNDLPLLEKVDHPVATNPDAHLRALAQSRQWRILDLFT